MTLDPKSKKCLRTHHESNTKIYTSVARTQMHWSIKWTKRTIPQANVLKEY